MPYYGGYDNGVGGILDALEKGMRIGERGRENWEKRKDRQIGEELSKAEIAIQESGPQQIAQPGTPEYNRNLLEGKPQMADIPKMSPVEGTAATATGGPAIPPIPGAPSATAAPATGSAVAAPPTGPTPQEIPQQSPVNQGGTQYGYDPALLQRRNELRLKVATRKLERGDYEGYLKLRDQMQAADQKEILSGLKEAQLALMSGDTAGAAAAFSRANAYMPNNMGVQMRVKDGQLIGIGFDEESGEWQGAMVLNPKQLGYLQRMYEDPAQFDRDWQQTRKLESELLSEAQQRELAKARNAREEAKEGREAEMHPLEMKKLKAETAQADALEQYYRAKGMGEFLDKNSVTAGAMSNWGKDTNEAWDNFTAWGTKLNSELDKRADDVSQTEKGSWLRLAYDDPANRSRLKGLAHNIGLDNGPMSEQDAIALAEQAYAIDHVWNNRKTVNVEDELKKLGVPKLEVELDNGTPYAKFKGGRIALNPATLPGMYEWVLWKAQKGAAKGDKESAAILDAMQSGRYSGMSSAIEESRKAPGVGEVLSPLAGDLDTWNMRGLPEDYEALAREGVPTQ